MDTVQWPHPVQEIVVKPMEEIQNPSSTANLQRRGNRPPQKEQAVNCPRCNSTNTKFCYYNNYSLSQPRYFCKTCKRYWTEGGSLRNIPVGGASRKNKRSTSTSSSSSVMKNKMHHDNLVVNQQPKIIQEGLDLIHVPGFDSSENGRNPLKNSSSSALELLTGINLNGGGPNFMPMSISDPDPIYPSGFSLHHEFKPTLGFSLEGIGIGNYGNVHQDNSGGGRILFPFEDLKQVSNNNSDHGVGGGGGSSSSHHGYWQGVLGGGGGGDGVGGGGGAPW